jgi:hypothetical protein
MCGAIKTATKIKWIAIIITTMKTIMEKKKHTMFVCPVRSNYDLLWGREQPSIPLYQFSNLTQDSQNRVTRISFQT